MKKADSLHLSRVAALGYIVCRNQNLGETPAEIHHIRTGQRADHRKSIPLCHMHHRNGGYGVAIHTGRRAWEMKYGTEAELLVQVLYMLGEGAHA